MPKRCRLTARAEIDGAIRDPGYVFVLPDGERGPHRAVRAVHPAIHASHVAGHDHDPSEGADEPLFVELPDDEPAADVAHDNSGLVEFHEVEAAPREDVETAQLDRLEAEMEEGLRDLRARRDARHHDPT